MIAKEKVLTPEAYLAAERKRSREEGKFEFLFGKMIEMPGATRKHNQICSNLNYLLVQQLRDTDLLVAGSDLRVNNPTNESFVYPDLVVYHEKNAIFLDDVLDTLATPLLVIEVLSESTEAKDRGDKFRMYRSIASLREYVLISQDQPLVEVFYKLPSGKWELDYQDKIESKVQLRSVQAELPLAEVYRKVKVG